MRIGAKLYITAICAAGGLGLLSVAVAGSWPDPWRFAAYCLITLIAAGMKVQLPGITGTMSVSYILVLAAIVETSWAEAIVIAVIANAVQMFWKPKQPPKLVQVLFNTASAVVTVAGAYQVYHYGNGLPSPIFRLAAAGCGYFILNTVAIAVVVSLTERKGLLKTWHDSYFWSFPYYLVGVSLSALVTFLSRAWGWELTLLVLPVLYIVFRSYSVHLGRLEDEKVYAEDMASLHLRTIEALALAIEAKDQTTGEHLRRVQVYAREIGIELGLSPDERMALQAASILHDIGKLAVPDFIISKPGRLTPEEFERMKVHPTVGAEILETISFPYPVAPIVRAHHEKWDGSGYPAGLKGEEIPIGARILTCVDCLDALASDRQYRRALPLDEALDVVKSESGKSFDPRVVDVLARRYLELEKLAWAEPMCETRKLSTDVKVERGASPDAGFQGEAASPSQAIGPAIGVPSLALARQELQLLYEAIETPGTALSLGEKLAVIAVRVRTLVPYDGIAIYLKEGHAGETKLLIPYYVTGEGYSLFSTLRIPFGQGLSGWVAENHKPILNGNPSVEPGYLNDPSKYSLLRSAVAVPLEGSSGCIGVMTLYSAAKDSFSGDHLKILLAVSSKIAPLVETALSFVKSKEQATTDPLTGLPNAAELFLQLEREIARAELEATDLSLLVFDFDGFRRVNEQHGQVTGNRLLRRAARAILATCGKQDHAARTGGDEFAVVLPGCGRESALDRRLAFEGAVAAVMAEAGFATLTQVSTGLVCLGIDGNDPDMLLAAADRDLYRKKRERRELEGAGMPGLMDLARSLDLEDSEGAALLSSDLLKDMH